MLFFFFFGGKGFRELSLVKDNKEWYFFWGAHRALGFFNLNRDTFKHLFFGALSSFRFDPRCSKALFLMSEWESCSALLQRFAAARCNQFESGRSVVSFFVAVEVNVAAFRMTPRQEMGWLRQQDLKPTICEGRLAVAAAYCLWITCFNKSSFMTALFPLACLDGSSD